ncbi:hypothetical protein FA13DRAFT_1796327 [Coprinellus micaceus]|uniref:Uncharacterized protein n=1 Tax=Coprinellus micaceus TaxID=71717 RepID=A0A4Y7SVJ2_COPMI|nr:hypothetical protein FA13DRAFT_1796327 [Coprinellus micaceus]
MSVHHRSGQIQSPLPSVILGHFIRQVQEHHFRTSTRAPRPLHYDTSTKSLAQYPWPCDEETGEKTSPSMLEAFRRTHEFKGPCCLCPLLDESNNYAEAFIGIIEVARHEVSESTLHGDGPFSQMNGLPASVRLETFFELPHLMVEACHKRGNPLPPQALNHRSDLQRAMDSPGLFQVINSPTIKGWGREWLSTMDPGLPEQARLSFMQKLTEGIAEEDFWLTFIQCASCGLVILRQGAFTIHKCNMPLSRVIRQGTQRNLACPYPSVAPNRHAPIRVLTQAPSRIAPSRWWPSIGDTPETRPLGVMQSRRRGERPTIRRSPTPTDVSSPRSEGSDSEHDEGLEADEGPEPNEGLEPVSANLHA